MQKATIIAEISGFKQRNKHLDRDNSETEEAHQTLIERGDVDTGDIGAHERIASLQILDSSKYIGSGIHSIGERVSGPLHVDPDDDVPIDSGRIINLNKELKKPTK